MPAYKPAFCIRLLFEPEFNSLLDGIVVAIDVDDFVFSFEFRLHGCFAEDAFERVYLVLNIVAELECRDKSLVDEDRFAGAGVACRASLAGLAGERAETTDFNGVAFDKLLAKEVEELFDDDFNIVAHKSGGFGDFLNKGLFSYISHALNISLTWT